mmetsp:Transcript_64201/g.140718  ORF Transcript_64201/g.140718 Transcript_64201/m.140718 type:complete len:212 (+) Transcript_64201:410-1045(+)
MPHVTVTLAKFNAWSLGFVWLLVSFALSDSAHQPSADERLQAVSLKGGLLRISLWTASGEASDEASGVPSGIPFMLERLGSAPVSWPTSASRDWKRSNHSVRTDESSVIAPCVQLSGIGRGSTRSSNRLQNSPCSSISMPSRSQLLPLTWASNICRSRLIHNQYPMNSSAKSLTYSSSRLLLGQNSFHCSSSTRCHGFAVGLPEKWTTLTS